MLGGTVTWTVDTCPNFVAALTKTFAVGGVADEVGAVTSSYVANFCLRRA